MIRRTTNAFRLMHLSLTSSGFLLYLCLLNLSIHRIQTQAADNEDLVSYGCLCVIDSCASQASLLPTP